MTALVRTNTHVHQWSTRHNNNNHEHFLERLDFFQRKNTPGAAMLYGNYGLGSFPESQLPLFPIICYSSQFQSKRRSDLWEIITKWNMEIWDGWWLMGAMICACKNAKGHKHPGGEGWRGLTLEGLHMSKWIKTIYFLVVMLLAHGVSSEEKVGQHGGKHFLTPALKSPLWESLLCWILVKAQVSFVYCNFLLHFADMMGTLLLFCFLVKMLMQSNKVLAFNIKSKKNSRKYAWIMDFLKNITW